MGGTGENGGPQWKAVSRAKKKKNSKANIHLSGGTRPIAHLRPHPISFPIPDLRVFGLVQFVGGKGMRQKEAWKLGTKVGSWVGAGGWLKEEMGEGAKSPRRARNVAADSPGPPRATPRQVSPPERNKDAARSASVLASPRPHPALRLARWSPRRPRKLCNQLPPRVRARGAGNRRRNGDNRTRGPEMPLVLVPSRTRRTTPGAAGPGPRAGRPAVPGPKARRFPPLP